MKENINAQTSVISITLPKWNVEEFSGYKPQTTFWNDFSIAERFGVSGIIDTFERAVKEWHSNIIYLTELVMVLNHKIWYHDAASKVLKEKGNERRAAVSSALSQLYNELWAALDAWCVEHLSGKDAEYYYRTLD